MIRPFLTALLCLFLSACAAVTPPTERTTAKHPPRDPALPPIFMPADTVSGNYLAGRHGQIMQQWYLASQYMQVAWQREQKEQDELLAHTHFLALASGHLELALASAHELDARGIDNTSATMLLFAEALKNGHWPQAEDKLAQIEGDGINQMLIPIFRAWLLQAQGETEAALAQLEQAAETQNLAALYLLHAGLIAELSADPSLAAPYYEAALASGVSLRGLQIIASYTSRHGEAERVQEIITHATEQGETGLSFVQESMARLHQGQSLDQVVSHSAEGLAEALLDVSNALGRDRNTEAALIYGHIAEYLRPGFDYLHFMLGYTLSDRGYVYESLRHLQQIQPESGFYHLARLQEVSLYQQAGLMREAIARAREVLAEQPQRSDAWEMLGDIYRQREDFVAAAQAYSSALNYVPELHSGHWALLFKRAIAYDRSDDWPRAERDLVSALKLDPHQSMVLNYLGYSWADRGLYLKWAKPLIELAVAFNPRDGHIIDSLGWIYYRLGQFEQAVSVLERATTLVPDEPEINDHLGDAYWQVGRKREARFLWQRALRSYEDKDNAAQIKKIRHKLDVGLQNVRTYSLEDGIEDMPQSLRHDVEIIMQHLRNLIQGEDTIALPDQM